MSQNEDLGAVPASLLSEKLDERQRASRRIRRQYVSDRPAVLREIDSALRHVNTEIRKDAYRLLFAIFGSADWLDADHEEPQALLEMTVPHILSRYADTRQDIAVLITLKIGRVVLYRHLDELRRAQKRYPEDAAVSYAIGASMIAAGYVHRTWLSAVLRPFFQVAARPFLRYIAADASWRVKTLLGNASSSTRRRYKVLAQEILYLSLELQAEHPESLYRTMVCYLDIFEGEGIDERWDAWFAILLKDGGANELTIGLLRRLYSCSRLFTIELVDTLLRAPAEDESTPSAVAAKLLAELKRPLTPKLEAALLMLFEDDETDTQIDAVRAVELMGAAGTLGAAAGRFAEKLRSFIPVGGQKVNHQFPNRFASAAALAAIEGPPVAPLLVELVSTFPTVDWEYNPEATLLYFLGAVENLPVALHEEVEGHLRREVDRMLASGKIFPGESTAQGTTALHLAISLLRLKGPAILEEKPIRAALSSSSVGAIPEATRADAIASLKAALENTSRSLELNPIAKERVDATIAVLTAV